MTSRPRGTEDALPRRVVALGGGTGLPAVLRGLRKFVSNGDRTVLTAIVTMSDDGGSSGRLRRTRGLPPPGDVRNCLVALSASEDLLSDLFQHRYNGGAELGGHNLGNLILAALAENTGSFLKAVEVSSAVLRTVGRILPVTLENVRLQATVQGGSLLVGETAIGSCTERIERVSLTPATAEPTPGVVEAIMEADLVVFGPGSLHTSVVPNLVLSEVSEALRRTSAVRVLVGNLVSGHCEAAGLALEDHLSVIEEHAGGRIVDALLAHDGPISEDIQRRYEEEGATPLAPPTAPIPGVHIERLNLLSAGPKLRHDSDATAAGLLEAWRAVSRDRSVDQNGGAPTAPHGTARAAS